ncbi:hypothetical protein B0H13DRAFT_2377749 [Mycena leptocephala]|nr:hypothetical protein B0H13DRAFT_2377749 [Mycena leptocephala]
MTSSSTPHWPIKLRFEDRVRVAGEIVAGHVDLNIVLANELHIQRLWIKLRGAIKTQITGSGEKPEVDSVPLIREKQTLWTPGSAFPKTGSQVLSCPFQFQLPENLHPSFHCSSESTSLHAGAISYSLEVIAERHGRLHANHQIRRLISVVPAATPEQLLTRESLRKGWTGQWRDIIQEKKIRQGIWGDYSHARAILSIPHLPSYPIGTPIPFRLQILTETKLVHRSDRPDKNGKPLFPAPPTQPSQLKQVLRRVTEIIVRDKTRRQTDTFDLPLTRGLDDVEIQKAKLLCEVQPIVDEPQWIPLDKDRGIWKRSVTFTPTLLFPFSPSLSTQTLDWQYELRFVVPFPGTGNDLKIWTPIELCASSASPVSPGATGSASLPPTSIHLSPSYWSGKDHDWGDNSEDGDMSVSVDDAVGFVDAILSLANS